MKEKLQITIYLCTIILLFSFSLKAQVVGVNNFPTNGAVNIGNGDYNNPLYVEGSITTPGTVMAANVNISRSALIKGAVDVIGSMRIVGPINIVGEVNIGDYFNPRNLTVFGDLLLKNIDVTRNLVVKGTFSANSFDPTTIAVLKTNLGLSSSNTGSQDLSLYALKTDLELKAPLASPAFTGTVTVGSLKTTGDSYTNGSSTTQGFSRIIGSNIVYGNSFIRGNVGIGTDGPTAKLHVIGDAKITGKLTVNGFAPATIATLKTDLGLSGSNTGSQDLSLYALKTDLSLKAPLDSPSFTGNVAIGDSASPSNLNVSGDATIAGTLTAGTFALANITTDNLRIGGLTIRKRTTATATDKDIEFIDGSVSIGKLGDEIKDKLIVNGSIIAYGSARIANDFRVNKDVTIDGLLTAKSFAPATIATLKTDLGLTGSNTGSQDLYLYALKTDLAARAPLVSPAFTGTVTAASVNTTGNVTIDGVLKTKGNVSIGTSDKSSNKKDLTVSGDVEIGKARKDLKSNLTVSGNSTTYGNSSIKGDNIITGNVGIGIVPTAKLHVNGNARIDGNLTVKGFDPTTIATLKTYLGLTGSNTGSQDLYLYALKTDLAAKAPLASPTFTGTVTAASVNTTGDVTIDGVLTANGNVNIGTDGLKRTLNVSGNTTIDGVLTANGNVNIGTDGLRRTLNVSGNTTIDGNLTVKGFDPTTIATLKTDLGLSGSNTGSQDLSLYAPLASPTFTETVTAKGSIVIGEIEKIPDGYKLFVEKGILTEKVKVAVNGSTNWADYVFHNDYKLMPLADVEQFIKTNNHLPNVLSAAEMVKEGNDLGKTDAKLLEKIEELTLYMIEMKKEIGQLKMENEDLKSAVNTLEKQ